MHYQFNARLVGLAQRNLLRTELLRRSITAIRHQKKMMYTPHGRNQAMLPWLQGHQTLGVPHP